MKNKALIVGLLSMLSLVSVANTVAFIPKGNSNYLTDSISSNAKPCISREDLEFMILNGDDVTQENTGCITDFSDLFSMISFNQDISGWNVSNGVDFNRMFSYNQVFNKDLSRWNVEKGENFSRMFLNSAMFSYNISMWIQHQQQLGISLQTILI